MENNVLFTNEHFIRPHFDVKRQCSGSTVDSLFVISHQSSHQYVIWLVVLRHVCTSMAHSVAPLAKQQATMGASAPG